MLLREYIAAGGLKTSLEGSFACKIELIDPDGVEYKLNADGEPLTGQVLYDRQDVDPESGNMITVGEISATLRRSSLVRVPEDGEKWGVRVPADPSDPDTLKTYVFNADESLTDGKSVGFIKLRLKEVEQS